MYCKVNLNYVKLCKKIFVLTADHARLKILQPVVLNYYRIEIKICFLTWINPRITWLEYNFFFASTHCFTLPFLYQFISLSFYRSIALSVYRFIAFTMVRFPELHFRCYMFLLNNMPFSYMRDIMDNFQAGHTALTTHPPWSSSVANKTSSLDPSKI